MAKHAILLPNWVGDLTLALSVIERKRKNSRDEFVLIAPVKLVELTERLTDLEVIPYRRSNRQEFSESAKAVRASGASKIYVLPLSLSSAWFAFRAGIPQRRGISGEFRSVLLTERLSHSTRNRDLHITKEYSSVLEAQYTDPETWVGKRLDPDPRYNGHIVLCPGANYGAAKRWAGFPELVKLLPDKEIVVLGGEDACEDAVHIEEAGKGRVTNLAGRTSLAEAAKIMSGATLVVSNDSGLMHVAGYLGIPLIGIFGSTSSVWTRPLGGDVRIAHKSVPCSPCFKRDCGKGHYNCLNGIKAQEINAMVTSLIGSLS